MAYKASYRKAYKASLYYKEKLKTYTNATIIKCLKQIKLITNATLLKFLKSFFYLSRAFKGHLNIVFKLSYEGEVKARNGKAGKSEHFKMKAQHSQRYGGRK